MWLPWKRKFPTEYSRVTVHLSRYGLVQSGWLLEGCFPEGLLLSASVGGKFVSGCACRRTQLNDFEEEETEERDLPRAKAGKLIASAYPREHPGLQLTFPETIP